MSSAVGGYMHTGGVFSHGEREGGDIDMHDVLEMRDARKFDAQERGIQRTHCLLPTISIVGIHPSTIPAHPAPLPEEAAQTEKDKHATQRTICDLRGLARGRGGSGAGRRRSWRYRRGRSILGRGHLRRWNKRHKLVLAAGGG